MTDTGSLRSQLAESLADLGHGRIAADRLCAACVDLLHVDGAALSVIYDGALSRSFGASNPVSRDLDEMQFTLGEGPCLEAVHKASPALTPDLNDPDHVLWPAFTGEALRRGVQAVFALPVYAAALPVGALDLYRTAPGRLDPDALDGALLAAELASVPLLSLMGLDLQAAVHDDSSSAWQELGALTRVEVYQAAGMVIAQLGVTSAEALVRIRGHAYAHDLTASEVAHAILERRLQLPDDQDQSGPGQERW